jgi:hypothetical protein
MAADAVAGETGLAEFGILGPLEVRRSGRAVPLGGPRQRAVLALLLLEANRAVSMDRLAEEIWGGDPPEGWVTTLQTYVFHLRRALEPDRLRGAAGDVLRVIVRVLCQCSRPRCSMSAPVASETRSPFKASSETSAWPPGGPSPAATSKAPSSLRSSATA